MVGKRPRLDVVVAVVWGATLLFVTYVNGVRKEQNVFRILRASFPHLVEGEDLYAPHPEDHEDLFKYPPPFAVLFAPFSVLPFPVGLLLWNAVNLGVLWLAIRRLLPPGSATLALAAVWLEAKLSIQHSQANALLAGLVVLAFVAWERRRQAAGAVVVALATFTKVFPLGAASFALFHRRRGRQAALLLVALALVAILPVLVAGPEGLARQYGAWLDLMGADARAQEVGAELPTGPGLFGGVMHQLRLWTGWRVPNLPVVAAGTLLLLLPLLRGRSAWEDPAFRLRFLASFLLYAVIFNPQSESPSFVIAMTGIAVWWAASDRAPWRTGILALALLLVSVAAQDFVPEGFRREVFYGWRLKTIPCVLSWVVVQAELWLARIRPSAPAPAAP